MMLYRCVKVGGPRSWAAVFVSFLMMAASCGDDSGGAADDHVLAESLSCPPADDGYFGCYVETDDGPRNVSAIARTDEQVARGWELFGFDDGERSDVQVSEGGVVVFLGVAVSSNCLARVDDVGVREGDETSALIRLTRPSGECNADEQAQSFALAVEDEGVDAVFVKIDGGPDYNTVSLPLDS